MFSNLQNINRDKSSNVRAPKNVSVAVIIDTIKLTDFKWTEIERTAGFLGSAKIT
jgi:hypothetical protein